MTLLNNQVQRLLENPSESLNIEIKTWIDPRTPEGIAKIVKGAFAIRNRNGGFLIIGLNNSSLNPDKYEYDVDVTQLFHLDRIQELVSKYANEPFEISVELIDHQNQKHPVIVIPEGVKIPSSVKSDLKSSNSKLLSVGDIYFRTLKSNGIPSSAKLLPGDLSALLDICFDNREADIGRFLRRQLGTSDASRLAYILNDQGNNENLKSLALAVIKKGEAAFKKCIIQRDLNQKIEKVLDLLTMRVGVVFYPKKEDGLPTQEFMNTVASSNPRYTGWPAWLDTRGFRDKNDRASVVDGAWETLIDEIDNWTGNFEFMRIDPTGEMFLRRVMQDDTTPSQVTPGTVMDVFLVVYRIAEILAVAINIARANGWSKDQKAGFYFQWSGLSGRTISSWANKTRFFFNNDTVSNSSDAESFVEISLDTPDSALAPHVATAVAPLFAMFNGYQMKINLIEDCVSRMVERRM